ncbi:hypothetical protein BDFG_05866 [Blastomyces dermatitidis ATCC 26199]|nr:hypothetical protein BDFG_05866 [Blastomyces dermatitidis ATCC 26199]
MESYWGAQLLHEDHHGEALNVIGYARPSHAQGDRCGPPSSTLQHYDSFRFQISTLMQVLNIKGA